MKKTIFVFCLMIASSILAFAQSDYKKAEFSVGYSNNQVDTGVDSGNTVQSFFDDRNTFHGFDASAVYNVHRYVGIKANVSGTYRERSVNSPITVGNTTGNVKFDSNRSLYNFLGGVQIKDNSSDARVKPFAHALVGAGHARYKINNAVCTGGITVCPSFISSDSETGLAGAFGGGIDIKVSDRVDIRAIQVDYNPIKFDGGTSNNVRFGIGVVFK
jgi:hypothetical protein